MDLPEHPRSRRRWKRIGESQAQQRICWPGLSRKPWRLSERKPSPGMMRGGCVLRSEEDGEAGKDRSRAERNSCCNIFARRQPIILAVSLKLHAVAVWVVPHIPPQCKMVIYKAAVIHSIKLSSLTQDLCRQQ